MTHNLLFYDYVVLLLFTLNFYRYYFVCVELTHARELGSLV